MWKNLKAISLFLSLGISQVSANGPPLLGSATMKWEKDINEPQGNATAPETPHGVFHGNGVFLTPDYENVIAVSEFGKMIAYNADSGDWLWDYDPPAAGVPTAVISSSAGVTFGSAYMVYAVNYVGDGDDYTRVIAVDMSGTELYVSESLDGKHSGNPVISSNGNYVFITHNSEANTVGHFTILSGALETIVTQTGNDNIDGPFAPIGIFHNPAEGFYDPVPGVADGTGNTNDMLLWCLTYQPNQAVLDGYCFGFQFPIGVAEDEVKDVEYFLLKDANTDDDGSRGFRTITPPVLANQGRSAYYSASRSQYYNFVGMENLNRARFNRKPNLKLQFEEDLSWRGQAVNSAPVVIPGENDAATVFGGTAGTEFFRLDHAFDENKTVTETTITKSITNPVYATALVDSWKRAVYYVEDNGQLHQSDYTTIEDLWLLSISGGVEGEMAINEDGSVVYAASKTGKIYGINVAEPYMSAPPSMFTTDGPTAAPTTAAPTMEPIPTSSPTPGPTKDDDDFATEAPTASGAVAKPLSLGFALVVSIFFF